jgi:hypothetical protein
MKFTIEIKTQLAISMKLIIPIDHSMILRLLFLQIIRTNEDNKRISIANIEVYVNIKM